MNEDSPSFDLDDTASRLMAADWLQKRGRMEEAAFLGDPFRRAAFLDGKVEPIRGCTSCRRQFVVSNGHRLRRRLLELPAAQWHPGDRGFLATTGNVAGPWTESGEEPQTPLAEWSTDSCWCLCCLHHMAEAGRTP
jgi:uncharacterized protein (TIGR02996 family)